MFSQDIWLWKIPEGTVARRLKGVGEVSLLAFSPEGDLLARAVRNNVYVCSMKKVLGRTGYRQLTQLEHKGGVTDLTFSPDGKYLATASGERARL